MVNLNLTIDDEVKEFNIPESWDEVTVEQFCELFSFNREELTPIELGVKTLNIFIGVDEETLMMLNYDDFINLINIVNFTNTDIDSKYSDSVEIEGETYFMKDDFSQLTMGEIISIETLIESSNGNIFGSMAKLLCIFLRKKKENGKLESFKGTFMNRESIFKLLPVSQVYGVFVFFLGGATLLENNMREYSENN
jgi:hypothetical protein